MSAKERRTNLLEVSGAEANRRRLVQARAGLVGAPRNQDLSRGGRYGERQVGGAHPMEAKR